MSWVWVPKETVLAIHARSLALYSGAQGLRDEGLLESALGRPQNRAEYKDATVFDLAAAYAFGITKNHPFVDGNKRTAFVTTALFLALNGFHLAAREAEATAVMLAFAAGEVSEGELSDWLKAQSSPRRG